MRGLRPIAAPPASRRKADRRHWLEPSGAGEAEVGVIASRGSGVLCGPPRSRGWHWHGGALRTCHGCHFAARGVHTRAQETTRDVVLGPARWRLLGRHRRVDVLTAPVPRGGRRRGRALHPADTQSTPNRASPTADAWSVTRRPHARGPRPPSLRRSRRRARGSGRNRPAGPQRIRSLRNCKSAAPAPRTTHTPGLPRRYLPP